MQTRSIFLFLFLISIYSLANATPLFSNVDGPNCLNAALLTAGLVKTTRYVSNGEIKTILESPLCRHLQNNEGRHANDIGVIWDNGFYSDKNIFSHAFVTIDDTKIYEKHGYSKVEPYQNSDLLTVMKEYEVPSAPACRANQSDRISCRMGTDFYRCQNLDQFIIEKRSQIKSFTLSYFRNLEDIELKLQDYLAHIQLVENKHKHLEIIRDLQVLARKMVNIPESSVVEENLIYKIIAHRFVSIAGQLNAIGYSDLRQFVWQWENQDKNIGDVFEAVYKLKVEDDLDLVYSKLRFKFLSIYGPIVKAERHVDLKLPLNEEFPEMAAGVSLYKDIAVIGLGIDVHRKQSMTEDAYVAMLCHEVGHLLGGKPYSSNTLKPSNDWVSDTPSSSEGQSDYFAGSCLKKYYSSGNDNSTAVIVPDRIKNLCSSKYTNSNDVNICLRSAKAGYEVMMYIASIYEQFGPDSTMPRPNMNLSEADGVSAARMYPSLQCRFDTYLAAALQEKQPGCWYQQ